MADRVVKGLQEENSVGRELRGREQRGKRTDRKENSVGRELRVKRTVREENCGEDNSE